jgi:hypothetical protein
MARQLNLTPAMADAYIADPSVIYTTRRDAARRS